MSHQMTIFELPETYQSKCLAIAKGKYHNGDPSTSAIAYAKHASKCEKERQDILSALKKFGACTDSELATLSGIDYGIIHRRRGELTTAKHGFQVGLVHGLKRPNKNGNLEQVWKAL